MFMVDLDGCQDDGDLSLALKVLEDCVKGRCWTWSNLFWCFLSLASRIASDFSVRWPLLRKAACACHQALVEANSLVLGFGRIWCLERPMNTSYT